MKTYHLSYADWSGNEYAAALGCLLSGKIASGSQVTRLADRFSELYAGSTAYPTNSGRTAIHIALSAFHRQKPQCTEVVIPSYICPSVVEAVMSAGLKPVYAAVGHDLNLDPAALADVFSDDTLAVIAPHMYGCPASIGIIEKVCRDAEIFLIDDAAQVIGVQVEGRQLGTFGDMGIISFAQSKAVVTGIRGSGGILLVNHAELDAAAKSAWLGLPPPSGRLNAFLDFLWNYLWSSHTGNTGYYLARIGERLGIQRNNKPVMARISNLEAAIALVQLERLEPMRQERLRVCGAYSTALTQFSKIAFPQYAPGRYLARIMLLLPHGADAATLTPILRRAGVRTRLGYGLPFASIDGNDMDRNTSSRLIGVPSGAEIGKAEAKEICAIINAALDSLKPE